MLAVSRHVRELLSVERECLCLAVVVGLHLFMIAGAMVITGALQGLLIEGAVVILVDLLTVIDGSSGMIAYR